MGAGPSRPAGQQQAFITSTKSLDVWLDQKNFRYSLHAIQRGYEWRKPQVVGLLDTIAKVATRPDDVVKLSEVVLLQLQTSRSMEELRTLQGERWYEDHERVVEVIDGQQRITTLVLIAAVVQHMLLDLSAKMTDSHPAKQHALQAVSKIEQRFTFDVNGKRHILLQGGAGGLDGGMFNFDADGNRALAEVLAQKTQEGQGPHQANSIHTFVWLSEKLRHLAGPPGASKKAKEAAATLPDVAAKQAEWLLTFLDVLATRVVWTTTLTTSRRLALDTFLNVNLDSHSVPLSEADVIKVALVSDLGRERDLTPALGHWDKCVKHLQGVAKGLKAEDAPYLTLLSKTGLTGALAPALLKDLLRHVYAIEKALAGSPVAVDATDGDLAQHFAARCLQVERWDPEHYMRGTLLEYAWAFSTMLTGKVQGERSTFRLLLQTEASLTTLLCLPNSTWRPAAVAIIREICKTGAPMRETSFAAQKLLADVMTQLECVAMRLSASGRKAGDTRTLTYMAIIKAAVTAGDHQDHQHAIRELKAALGAGALCRLAFGTMESLPGTFKLAGGGLSLIRDLYTKDIYNNGKGRLATAVLLSVETSEHLKGVRDGGFERRWKGKITVEHLLPQTPGSDWQERFGQPDGLTNKAFVHKLGNLSILSPGDNSRLGNRKFSAKRVKMNDMNLDYRTLDMVMKLDGCWDMGAILQRQRWLLERLAQRFDVEVPESSWTEWREELLSKAGNWQQLVGGQELMSAMGVPASSADPPSRGHKRKHQEEPAAQSPQPAASGQQLGAAGSAAGTGDYPGGPPTDPEAAHPGAQSLREASELAQYRRIEISALAGTLEPDDARLLLRSAKKWCLPTSREALSMPEAGSLYLFHTGETASSYKADGYNWKRKPSGGISRSKWEKTVDGVTLFKITRTVESGTLKRCIYYLKFSTDADMQDLASYKLVHYVAI